VGIEAELFFDNMAQEANSTAMTTSLLPKQWLLKNQRSCSQGFPLNQEASQLPGHLDWTTVNG